MTTQTHRSEAPPATRQIIARKGMIVDSFFTDRVRRNPMYSEIKKAMRRLPKVRRAQLTNTTEPVDLVGIVDNGVGQCVMVATDDSGLQVVPICYMFLPGGMWEKLKREATPGPQPAN